MAVENTKVDDVDVTEKAAGNPVEDDTLTDPQDAGGDGTADAEPDPDDEELDDLDVDDDESDDEGLEDDDEDDNEPEPKAAKPEPKAPTKAPEKPKAKYAMDDDEVLDAFGDDEEDDDDLDQEPPQRQTEQKNDPRQLDDLFAPTLSVDEVRKAAREMDPVIGKTFIRMAHREEVRAKLIRYAMGELRALSNEIRASQTADVRQAFSSLVDAGADEIYGVNPASASKSQRRNQAKVKQLARQIRQRAMAAGEPVSVTRAVQLAHRKLFPAPPSPDKGKPTKSIAERLKPMQRQRDFVPGTPSVPSRKRNTDEAMDDAIANFLR